MLYIVIYSLTLDVQGFAEAMQSEMGAGTRTDQPKKEAGEGEQGQPEGDKGEKEDSEEQEKTA